MPQNATESTLTPKQQKVLDALLCGQSVADAAKIGGCDRCTVHRWMRHHFEFQAEFNRRRLLLKDEFQMRLVALAERATKVVQESLDAGDSRVAMTLLSRLGLMAPLEPGSTNATQLENDSICAELFAGLDK